jgi:hypothetical protein
LLFETKNIIFVEDENFVIHSCFKLSFTEFFQIQPSFQNSPKFLNFSKDTTQIIKITQNITKQFSSHKIFHHNRKITQ